MLDLEGIRVRARYTLHAYPPREAAKQMVLRDVPALVAEVDRLRARIDIVLRMHPMKLNVGDRIVRLSEIKTYTGQERYACGHCKVPWPCDTVRAIEEPTSTQEAERG